MLELSTSSSATDHQRQTQHRDHFVSQGAATQNKQRFVDCMEQHEKMLRHMILGFEAKAALQEELFQDISLNIWQALPKFKGEASLKTFVARIAHNILATHVAKAVRTVKAEDNIEDQHDLASEERTPYQELNQAERQQRLAHGIRQLKLEQQQVITLALEGMSYQEMADILNISSNLVGVRLQRAKTNLMQLVQV